MRGKDIAVVVLAVFLVWWLGGWALGLVHHLVSIGIRLVVLVAIIALIIHLASARRV